jgi:hypothetical protein
MRGDMYFFDVPIYRCTLDKHTKEMEIEKKELTKILDNSGFTRDKIPESYSNLESHFDTNIGYSWKYNDIIGWVRLFVCGTQLRGDLWWISSSRIIRRGKKQFRYFGKAFESQSIKGETSSEIFEILCICLKELSKERPIKGRYIDMELLLNLGPYVNWRRFMDSTTPHSRNNE